MRAAWYEQTGPSDVLQVGELPDPEPGPGEVRVRIAFSGVNPGDTKKREDRFGVGLPFDRVIPHSDGAGVVDAVGEGVDRRRVGERVWVFGAQSGRPSGTAAERTVVPQDQAVLLPQQAGDALGACLGIPGLTAHRAVFGDGPVARRTVLVHGVLGAVGRLAAQLAAWNGATVIGTVRRRADLDAVEPPVAHAVALDTPEAADAILELAPDGVGRIVEVDLAGNADLDAAVAAQGATIAAYATHDPRPSLDFWPLLFQNVTLRMLGSDDFPAAARHQAVVGLTAALRAGALDVPIGDPLPLDAIAEAHDRVDAGPRARVVLDLR